MGKVLTEVRSPQRNLIPDTVDRELHEQTSLRGIANKVKWKPYFRVSYGFTDCESEYDRGAGCGRTARPDLYGGRQVTGVPTMSALNTRSEIEVEQSKFDHLKLYRQSDAHH